MADTEALGRDLARARLSAHPLTDETLSALKQKYPYSEAVIDAYDSCYEAADGSFSDAACTVEKDPKLRQSLPQSAFEDSYVDWAIGVISSRTSTVAEEDFAAIVHELVDEARAAGKTAEALKALQTAAGNTRLGASQRAEALGGVFDLDDKPGWSAIFTSLRSADEIFAGKIADVFADRAPNPHAVKGLFEMVMSADPKIRHVATETLFALGPECDAIIVEMLKKFRNEPTLTDDIRFCFLRIEIGHRLDFKYLSELLPFLNRQDAVGDQAHAILHGDDGRYPGEDLWAFYKKQDWRNITGGATLARTRILYVACKRGTGEAALPLYQFLSSPDPTLREFARMAWMEISSSGKAMSLLIRGATVELANGHTEDMDAAFAAMQNLFSDPVINSKQWNLKIEDQAQLNLLLALKALMSSPPDTQSAGANYLVATSLQTNVWQESHSELFGPETLEELQRYAAKSTKIRSQLYLSAEAPSGFTTELDRSTAAFPAPVLPGAHLVTLRNTAGDTISARIVVVGMKSMSVDLVPENVSAPAPEDTLKSDTIVSDLELAPPPPDGSPLDMTDLAPLLEPERVRIPRRDTPLGTILSVAGGVVLAGAGGYSAYQYLRYREANTDMADMADSPSAYSLGDFNAAHEQRESSQIQAQIFGGVGAGGLALAGVGFVITLGDRKKDVGSGVASSEEGAP